MGDQNKYAGMPAYTFFHHQDCEFFPCHKTDDPENFNCLFCYCPLYALGRHCGGNFQFVGGVKDCSQCMVPHKRENYFYIINQFQKIVELIQANEEKESGEASPSNE